MFGINVYTISDKNGGPFSEMARRSISHSGLAYLFDAALAFACG